jgi:hypothetical protein
MTVEELEIRWKSIINDGISPYRSLRISADCIPELYLSLDIKSHRYLILQVPPEVKINCKSVQLEHLSLEWNEESRYILIGLQTKAFTDLFNDLTLSLYSKIKNIPSANAYTEQLIIIFQKWAEFFDASSLGRLTENAIKGIFGELIMLRELLRNSADIAMQSVIEAWQGPYNRAQDFFFPEFNLEVKTKDSDQVAVRISSEYQLKPEPGKEIKLGVVEVIRHEDGENLAMLVQQIKTTLTTNGCEIEPFFKTLLKAGLNNGNLKEYDGFKWQAIKLTVYNCTSSQFPKIISSSLDEGISLVKYNISLNFLSKFIIQTIPINGH